MLAPENLISEALFVILGSEVSSFESGVWSIEKS